MKQRKISGPGGDTSSNPFGGGERVCKGREQAGDLPSSFRQNLSQLSRMQPPWEQQSDRDVYWKTPVALWGRFLAWTPCRQPEKERMSPAQKSSDQSGNQAAMGSLPGISSSESEEIKLTRGAGQGHMGTRGETLHSPMR